MKLNLENIRVKLGGEKILNNISLSIEKNHLASVLGPSGCGKSTLLKAIAGVIPCESGTVSINGLDVTNAPTHKRGAVIVFQDIRLFPHMNVFDNIGFSMKMKGIKKTDYARKVNNLLEQVRLKGFENRKPAELSGGEAQRVALARALAAEPEILLLDEPFSGLDENLRFDMRLLVSDLHMKHNITTIMVTHDKEEALGMSDTLIVIDKGGLLQKGAPKYVYENPANLKTAEYFGNAAFVNGKVFNKQFRSTEFSFPCNKENGEYRLMVRYEAVRIVCGNDFRLIRFIYSGTKDEALFEHMETGLRLKCAVDNNMTSDRCDKVSFELATEKLRLFKLP